MKAALMAFVLAFGTFLASAQGTFDFAVTLNGANVVPPSSTALAGSGTLELDGNILSYDIRTDYVLGWTGYFYGPAEPGMNGPALFQLRNTVCEPPNPVGYPGYCLFQGSVMVSDAQIDELVDSLWYVQITSNFSADRAMRGQITLVPEPHAAVIGLLALAAVLTTRRKKVASVKRTE